MAYTLGTYFLDLESGSDAARTALTTVTVANPSGSITRATKTAHGLVTGAVVDLTLFTAWLNEAWKITVVDANNFDLVGAVWQATADNDGTATPRGGSSKADAWLTLTSGATAARIAPGDTIRMMSAPNETSLGTGGFSMYAAKHGCEIIHSVDSSVKAIDLCNKNAVLNNATNHEGFAVDTFDYLKDHGKNYDIIILDPPAFAKSRDVSHNAVIGYKRLNQMALQNIKKGGILFTFSCSGVIDKKLFYNTVTAAAIESRRNLKLLHTLSQPADHIITPNFPEGEYLKGLAFYVE